METPDPILPESTLVPTFLWLGVLLITVTLSVLHAVHRKRGGWVIGMVLVPPAAIVAYWVVELLRPSGWTGARQAAE